MGRMAAMLHERAVPLGIELGVAGVEDGILEDVHGVVKIEFFHHLCHRDCRFFFDLHDPDKAAFGIIVVEHPVKQRAGKAQLEAL